MSSPATVRSTASRTTSGPADRDSAGAAGGRPTAWLRGVAAGVDPRVHFGHAPPGEHHPAFEEYCEAIFELAEGTTSTSSRCSSPIVYRSAASGGERDDAPPGARRTDLHRRGHRLTDRGRALAEIVVRRHRLAERFLRTCSTSRGPRRPRGRQVGEHGMSASVETAMNRLLGSPTTCPHGNPIQVGLHRAARLAVVDGRCRPALHHQPDPRGAGVHARSARVPRSIRSLVRAPMAR